ncbi:winged helix-turn-helix domain-containing protein [Haloarcula sp. Atlit-120R]|uniref:winged helix-turn-helix domain-containing protein n=1 Tax=Haloarcula sp. Atlit-120R TaxID=2282135 RepID=UPI000EF2148F|nr:winged helix-turn-helix domain-containing protein [Haloarcula sp. Atlit-120R]RLM32658.1 ArsR family transcriptional regulator [Haloarcula sp. Atlit-120R]
MSTDVDYDRLSYTVSSRYREAVVSALTSHPSTPSKIAARTDDDISHISRALNELREKDVVELLVNEDRKKGRVYALTDHGETLADELEGWDDE